MRNTYAFLTHCLYICGIVYIFLINPTSLQSATPTLTITPAVTATPTPSSDVVTDDATDITSNSATLNGRIYKYAVIWREWYEYGTASGSLDHSAEIQGGAEQDSYYKVSTNINELSPEATYYYRLAGQDKMNTYYGSEKSFTTLSATATPVTTPTSECEPVFMNVSPKRMILQRGQAGEVTVTLEGDNCFPTGNIVTANISKVGSKRISVLPTSAITDEAGKATFTITAKDKIGKAKVTFNTWNLKKAIIVRVK